MCEGNDYQQKLEEAAARVEWCERKLSYERKRHRALRDLAATEDWLNGKSRRRKTRQAGTDPKRRKMLLFHFAIFRVQPFDQVLDKLGQLISGRCMLHAIVVRP